MNPNAFTTIMGIAGFVLIAGFAVWRGDRREQREHELRLHGCHAVADTVAR